VQPSRRGKTLLDRAGLAGLIKRQFSIETARSHKPSQTAIKAMMSVNFEAVPRFS
jgi:hypothetical protein